MPGPPGLTKFARKTLFRFSGTKLNRLLIWHLYEGKPQEQTKVFGCFARLTVAMSRNFGLSRMAPS